MRARTLALLLLLVAGCGRALDAGSSDANLPADLGGADLTLGSASDGGITCGDLGTDAQCGACGRACEVIASGQLLPVAIAVDSDIVYWRNLGSAYESLPPGPIFYSDGTLVSSPVDGSQSPTTLGSALLGVAGQPPSALAVVGGQIYFTQSDSTSYSGSVYTCPLAGCGSAPTLLAPESILIGGVAVDAGGAYWTRSTPIAIRVADLAGATETTLWAPTDPTAPGTGVGSGIAVDATDVYWTNSIGQILTCPRSGCGSGPTVVGAGNSSKSVVVLDANNVYWTNEDGDGLGQIYQCQKSGCGTTPILLADGRDGPLGLAVDDHDVYWTEIYGGTISRCAIGGCGNQPTLLAAQLASPVAIALDAGYVYWTEEGTFSYGIDTIPGSVKRMAK